LYVRTFLLYFLLKNFRILVGAPEADSRQPGVEKAGAVFRCSCETNDNCQLIPFDRTGKYPLLGEWIIIHLCLKRVGVIFGQKNNGVRYMKTY